jgi:gluconokinase
VSSLDRYAPAVALVLMGVAGAGKTTVGGLLIAELGWKFFDADDYHSPENVAKMRDGIPLNDEDRFPWLDRLRDLLGAQLAANQSIVLACSALRQSYRRKLLPDDPQLASQVIFVYLRVKQETALRRLRARNIHYMPASLVSSQFETLEEPESAITIDAEAPFAEIVHSIKSVLARL